MKERFSTLCVHAGSNLAEGGASCGVPIHKTAAYLFNNTQHASNLFALKELGHIYSRMSNPTVSVLEERLALLENNGKAGAYAVALASGTSAVFYSIINVAERGDSIVAAANLYGGVYTMLDAILPQFGISTNFVPHNDLDAFEKAITEKTRAIFIESIGNPGLDLVDIEAVAKLAHKHNLPLIVDNTFATPYLLRPFEYGADVVVYSLTKWMCGHGVAIAGAVIDANSFNWKNEKFSLYNKPDMGYHGLRWAHDIGELPAYGVRMRTVPLRNLGACLSPDTAWMVLLGLETLPLRMEKHSSNALKVAKYLSGHDKVLWVKYPGLSEDNTLSSKYLPKGAGGMVVFGLKGNSAKDAVEKGAKFIDNLQLFSHLANVGDAKSLAIHPASTTHSQLAEEQQRDAGVLPEMVRLSIGIEDADDIIEDLAKALDAVN